MLNINDQFDLGKDNSDKFVEYELASAGDRLNAALIDIAVLIGLYFLPNFGKILGFAYFLLRDSLPFLKGQSIGKRLMKIRVIDIFSADDLKEKYDKSIIRTISLIIPVFNIIDAIMVYTDPEKKRFGDKWAGTIVTKER